LEDVSRKEEALAIASALRLDSDWIQSALREGIQRLERGRGHIPDAKGIVFAQDQDHAEGVARHLARLAGRANVRLAVSRDGKEADRAVENFENSNEQWLVTVRMVGEGVDIPKLLVGVHATSERTRMGFNQRLGRVQRVRGLVTDELPGQYVLPSTPTLVRHAREAELDAAHAIATRAPRTGGGTPGPTKEKSSIFVLGAKNGEVGGAILHGETIDTPDLDHATRLLDTWNTTSPTAIPWSPAQMAQFLSLNDRLRSEPDPAHDQASEFWREEKDLGKRLQSLVIQVSHARGHRDYGETWKEINRAVGEYTSVGSSEPQRLRRERILIEWLERANAGV
jgi:superfamily II DNA/RNA helicase